MAKPKLPMHIEAKRGWFSGVSTTLCGTHAQGQQGQPLRRRDLSRLRRRAQGHEEGETLMSDYIHIGRKSFWDSSVTTLCG
ncbi:MAG: hypothetical protein M3548_09755, partial [Actinomycetota bacterium]|nr:hypothetical protein [Actinomycetota bacterium]